MTSTDTAPDIILFNGHVATQNPNALYARALAIRQGRIVAVGNDDAVLPLSGAGTERIDLQNRMVVPGFIDTHIHFYEWSLKRRDMALDDVTGPDDLLERVRKAAEKCPKDQWIIGQGWNETDWSDPRMPTRSMLDRAAPDHPVLLWRCDLHLAAANSEALAQGGIDARTPNPPEGRIERDEHGEPTGILRELAINLVRRAVSPPGSDEIMTAFEDGAKALHRRGVTGIHDIRLMADEDGARAFGAFQELDRRGRLDLRTWVSLPGHRLDEIIALGLRTGFGNDRLRVGHVKYFSDGGMGARTAWMIDPFQDAGHGMPLTDMALLALEIKRAEAAGLSVMVHAVGDRANRELVDLFEALETRRKRKGLPSPPMPHRIEHVQMIRPEDRARLRKSKVALCVTPANLLLDIHLIDKAVGDTGRYAYAFRPLVDTGAPVMFSSDCPVCDPAPLLGIHAAVSRQRTDGTPAGGWHPANRVSVSEAIAAYTAVPATVHKGSGLGRIVENHFADLAVLSENIASLPPSRIAYTSVDMTLFNGTIVHRRF